MRVRWVLLVLCLIVGCGCACAWGAEEKKSLRATAVSSAPVIDGDLSDSVWRSAGVSGGFRNEDTGAAPSQPTLVYALSDADHLYLGFRCAEPNPEKMHAGATTDNASVWEDDCLEMNFDPTGGSEQIYQLLVNSIGTKEFRLRGASHLEVKDIRAAGRVTADQWTLEIALPFAAVGISRSPQVEMHWRVNFERLRTVEGKDEDLDWQYTAGDWANPNVYGQVVIPGAPLTLEGFGHPPLAAGLPSGGFASLSNHSSEPLDLEVAVTDVTVGAQLASDRVTLSPRQTARVPVDFSFRTGGERRYRWLVRDLATGALLYSYERVVQVEKTIRAYVYYHSRQLLVEADTGVLGELPPDATVQFDLIRAGAQSPVLTVHGRQSPDEPVAVATFKCEGLEGGDYEVRAQARNRSGRSVGSALSESVTWPKELSWPGAPKGLKVLNNLVTELLNVQPGSAASQDLTFYNPRDGWVYLASTANVGSGGEVRISVDGHPAQAPTLVQSETSPAVAETMRYLKKGDHVLRLLCTQPYSLQRLVVRAVPELIFCHYQYNPHVAPYGPYDWDFLSRYVLPHANTIVGGGGEEQVKNAREWREKGGRFIIECYLKGLEGDKVTADEVYDFWLERVLLPDHAFDGAIVDEYFGGESENYPAWQEAMLRLYQHPRLQNFNYYPYCGSMYEGRRSTEFIRKVMDLGSRFAWERYLREEPTESKARKSLQSTLTDETVQWEKALPGAVRHMIMCFGYLCAPPESLNVNPRVDYRTWMDMQFRWIANDPTFFGLYGVMEYTSGYADEESVRLAARLYRHYFIEGNTEPFIKDPYRLTHLRNPDFEDGLNGWNVEPAEKGSISTGAMEGYSYLEGRYPQTKEGDTFLVMRRSAQRPNVVSQRITGLERGRLYSLKMFTGDHKDLSAQEQHAVSIQLDGVELIPEKCFQYVFHNCYGHYVGQYDENRAAWMNFYWRVFRAKNEEAVIRISDWASENEPGAPIGQELMFNFVEVEPYFAE